MKEFENPENDILKEWIESVGKDNAPNGFTEKIMNRINIESSPSEAYNSPISLSFKIGSVVILSVLILMAILSTGPVEYPWYTSINEKIGQVSSNLPALQELGNVIGNFSFLLYISIGILLVILFDRLLSRLFARPV